MDVINQSIFKFIISALGVSSIIIYLGKRFIDKTLEAGVQKYKSTLDRELEGHKAGLLREIEKFKAELKILELEHHIKFNKLHEERAKTIKEIYSLLIDMEQFLIAFTSPFQGPEWKTDVSRENKAKDSFTELRLFFLKNRILFSNSFCKLFDEVLDLSWNIIVEMSSIRNLAQYDETGPEMANSLREWKKQHKRVIEEIEKARTELENEFRKIIGVQ